MLLTWNPNLRGYSKRRALPVEDLTLQLRESPGSASPSLCTKTRGLHLHVGETPRQHVESHFLSVGLHGQRLKCKQRETASVHNLRCSVSACCVCIFPDVSVLLPVLWPLPGMKPEAHGRKHHVYKPQETYLEHGRTEVESCGFVDITQCKT